MKRRVAVIVAASLALIGAPAVLAPVDAGVSAPAKAPLCLGVPGIDLGYCLKLPKLPNL